MIKYYCDKCEQEIAKGTEAAGGHIVGSRLGTELTYRTYGQNPLSPDHVLKLELIATFDGTANTGIFCKYCLIDAFRRLDDRPQAE